MENQIPPAPKPARNELPPYSYRPNDDAKRKFLADLLDKTGSRQLAIDHCVNLAMEKFVPTPANPEATNKLQKELEAARAEIKALKEKPNPTAGYTPTGNAAVQLEEVSKKKGLSNIAFAIEYCINYTKQNLW